MASSGMEIVDIMGVGAFSGPRGRLLVSELERGRLSEFIGGVLVSEPAVEPLELGLGVAGLSALLPCWGGGCWVSASSLVGG